MASKLSVWQRELQSDPDRDFLLTGIEHGFYITDENVVFQPVERDNYTSATHPQIRDSVEQQILSELAEGNYLVCQEKPTIVSSLGAIVKPNNSTPSFSVQHPKKVRLIHDASQPPGLALNDFASTQKFSYQTFDDALKLLTPNCFLAKVDLGSAYRSVSIHPSCHQATGLKWTFTGHDHPTYMIDSKLPFGSSKAPHIFHRISQSVRRMMARRGLKGLVVYLDDFCIICDTYDECSRALNMLISLLRQLGFQISWSKVEGPTRMLTFLGITIDTRSMTLSLPKQKLQEVTALLTDFAARRRASRRQLQSLAGKLNWCCQVIPAGRPYLRRILDTMLRLKKQSHKAQLTTAFRLDIQWWRTFLDAFNGTLSCLPPTKTFSLQVDACNSGCGLLLEGDWAYYNWSVDFPHLASLHINHKETVAIVLAALRWAPLWQNCTLNVYTDSVTAKAAINKGYSKNKTVMAFLRQLFWLSAMYQFRIRAYHVAGCRNTIPDTISRLSTRGFLQKLASLFCSPTGFQTPQFFLTLPCHMSHRSFFSILPQVSQYLLTSTA